eukprot:1134187-Pelagomonas_calceolata.AAC.1
MIPSAVPTLLQVGCPQRQEFDGFLSSLRHEVHDNGDFIMVASSLGQHPSRSEYMGSEGALYKQTAWGTS